MFFVFRFFDKLQSVQCVGVLVVGGKSRLDSSVDFLSPLRGQVCRNKRYISLFLYIQLQIPSNALVRWFYALCPAVDVICKFFWLGSCFYVRPLIILSADAGKQ